MAYISQEDYGAKLMVTAIDEKAEWVPNHTFLRYPGPDWETMGYSSITWRQYVDGINKIAHWLDEQLGQCSTNDAIAYMGPNDARYAFILPALIKTNRKLLLPDGRITKDGLRNLVSLSECKVWLFAQEDVGGLEELGVPGLGIKMQPFPSLEWCLSAEGTPNYPYEKKWDEAKYDEILIIHTSGTTGLPKPIFMNNWLGCAGVSGYISRTYWPQGITSDLFPGRTVLSACPPKWSGGIMPMTLMAAFTEYTLVIAPAGEVGISPDLFKKILRFNRIDGLWSPPHTIVGLYNDPTTNPLLKRLDSIAYLGASLDRAVGDDLCLHTKLVTLIGSTETGIRFILTPRDRKLWNTVAYVPEGLYRYVKREGSGESGDGSDDLYELVFDRPADGAPSIFQGTFVNFRMYGQVDTVETRELYSPVKDLDGSTRWEFKARTDDLLKLNWLAKFNAKDIEAIVLRHPAVKHVFVGGEGRTAPFVIVELKDDMLQTKAADDLLDEIYGEAVSKANEADIGEIRIPRETVFLAKKEKPFKVNLKHLVVRREVESDYQTEIDEIYQKFDKTA